MFGRSRLKRPSNSWSELPITRACALASGTALPDDAGLKPMTLRLTAAGKRLLRRKGSVKVQTAIGTRAAIHMTLKR